MHALAIFIGAFLLFQVQPLLGKFILPWFGGSPGVWTTAMLFFQTVLLAGYAYAHWLTRLSVRTQATTHLVLLAVALATLPVLPSDAWKPASGDSPAWGILMMLAATAGVPYFVLSATGPLLQSWFSLMRPGVSPYRLYALSNFGSLLALVSYPLVIEPWLSRSVQAWAWSGGMGFFTLLCGACAVQLRRDCGLGKGGSAAAAGPFPRAANPSRRDVVLWFALPALASTLMLATTNKICQDIAVVPFLWVLPLGLYLLTFILSFDHPRWYSRTIFGTLAVLVFLASGVALIAANRIAIGWQVGIHLLTLFAAGMCCHGELARLRPAPARLTHYFLVIAAGGALGGLAVAVVAPMIFDSFLEFHFALVGVALVLLALVFTDSASPLRGGPRLRISAGLLIACAALIGLLVCDIARSRRETVLRMRNFYGVLNVLEHDRQVPRAYRRGIRHGNITHGMQFVDPVLSRLPTAYYTPQSGVGLLLRHFPRHQSRRVGIVGLGVGTLALYGQSGDLYRFYEINPAVIALAENFFTCLLESDANIEVMPGDARLSLEREPPQQFDILVLDAFSSDSIPVHLLTREAFDLYLRHVRPDGAIAVHISNRHLWLEPVIATAGERIGWRTVLVADPAANAPPGTFPSTWVVMTRNAELLAQTQTLLPVSQQATRAAPFEWTDDYAPLWGLLVWKK